MRRKYNQLYNIYDMIERKYIKKKLVIWQICDTLGICKSTVSKALSRGNLIRYRFKIEIYEEEK